MQSIDLARALGRREGMAYQLANLGLVAETRGDLATARRHWTQSLTLFQEFGAAPAVAKTQGFLDARD